MSQAHDTTAHPRAEDDHVDSRAVLLVGVAALLIFALAGLSAIGYLRLQVGRHPGPALPPELGRSKIGLVEQQLFGSAPLRSDGARQAELARLHGAGWVDRAAGVAHIPIETAMALVSQGVRPPPGAPGETPALGAEHGGVDAPSVPIAVPGAEASRGAQLPGVRPGPARGGSR